MVGNRLETTPIIVLTCGIFGPQLMLPLTYTIKQDEQILDKKNSGRDQGGSI